MKPLEISEVREIETFAFGDITKEELIEMFSDGRTSSPFMEIQLTKWFSELQRVGGDSKFYDMVDANGNCYEVKGLTRNGCDVAPSSTKGVGRKRNGVTEIQEGIEKHNTTFIITDIQEFPKIYIKTISGEDLLKQFPKGKISAVKGRNLLLKDLL